MIQAVILGLFPLDILLNLRAGAWLRLPAYDLPNTLFPAWRQKKTENGNGMVFLLNDLYQLEKEMFRLYYTSVLTEQQTIDINIIDSFDDETTFTMIQ